MTSSQLENAVFCSEPSDPMPSVLSLPPPELLRPNSVPSSPVALRLMTRLLIEKLMDMLVSMEGSSSDVDSSHRLPLCIE